jgi:hypothetical protein
MQDVNFVMSASNLATDAVQSKASFLQTRSILREKQVAMLGCLLIAGIFRVFAGTQESVLAELVILSAFQRTAEILPWLICRMRRAAPARSVIRVPFLRSDPSRAITQP